MHFVSLLDFFFKIKVFGPQLRSRFLGHTAYIFRFQFFFFFLNWTVTWIISNFFLVLVLMLRILKVDFLQEGTRMSRIANFFASFTFLAIPTRIRNRKTWLIKQATVHQTISCTPLWKTHFFLWFNAGQYR